MKHRSSLSATLYLLLSALLIAVLILCVCIGSVSVPLADTARILAKALSGRSTAGEPFASIILTVRLPRVLCTFLTGAALSISGAAMQGLLKNPLADGSTLGVSSGASLGAVTAIAFGSIIPGLSFKGTMVMAILFSAGSLFLILALSYRIDCSLSTSTVILTGVIFSMFASSLMSVIITFAPEKLRQITFWTMGSLSGTSFSEALLLAAALLICSTILICCGDELNAFSIGEEEAAHIGVNVKAVKLTVLITVSVLIGISVSVSGTISFVGLVTPHIVRLLAGPDHKKLLPLCIYAGGIFLLLADLVARCLLRPVELPIGVVTGIIGAVVFVVILYRTGGGRSHA